jgi:GrpB-like predicted nucleotidyltransferase (UPF0157 family)
VPSRTVNRLPGGGVRAGWKARLSAQLGNAGQRVEHVGSRAVPGLAAKPVIDIQVSAPDLAAEDLIVLIASAE